jgi:2-(1,2-epoxy-1,2-dihydrophenyl)acetyl-CoA isomerase
MSDSTILETEDLPWHGERHGPILVATLNRPAVRNALNFAAWTALDDLIAEAGSDPGIRALVLTGAGGVFSAGGDMKNPEPRGDGLMKEAARLKFLHDVLRRLAACPVPTIAAVEGPAVGVAWGLALTCDYVIAAESAKFMAPFAQRSLVPDGGIAFHLVRALGRLRATEILLSGRALSGAECFSFGLASEAVSTGEALTRSLVVAERLAQPSRDTTGLTLRAIRRAEQAGYRDYLDAELELAALNLHNPDVTAARMSFKKSN